MKVAGVHHRSIALAENGWAVRVIDQRGLPWELKFVTLETLADAARAIRDMCVRGAPLIGATAAYGIALAMRADASDGALTHAYETLLETRPTAINLKWALDEMVAAVRDHTAPNARAAAAYRRAADICDEDVRLCQSIGQHGAEIIRSISAKKSAPVNILTHCNTGWLACVDYGTALSAIYTAHDASIPLHVWVDETRPRNQGSALTAWELAQHGVPHTVITDNAGGLLMQRGQVDVCIVGADRVTRNGDVCNKIGTYLKALAAHDNSVPFYVALPYTTFDLMMESGTDIPIEDRAAAEVTHITGRTAAGRVEAVQLTASPAANPGFDITPARLVTGYVTERGIEKKAL